MDDDPMMLESNEDTHRIGIRRPPVIWLTGISGAGKTTLARLLEKSFAAQGRRCYVLDGDDMRRGISADLGYSDSDRRENIRRAREIAYVLADAGLVVIASFISPFRSDRQLVRERFESGQFIEVFVDTPLSTAEARDVKGLYRKARDGSLAGFTGIDSRYEAPTRPDLHIRTAGKTEAESLQEMLVQLGRARVLD